MKQYQLQPSKLLFSVTLTLYLIALLSLWLNFTLSAMTLLVSTLILLLAYVEVKKYRQQISHHPEWLSLRLVTGEINWKSIDSSRSFTEYTVYNSRWGMVLKLKSQWTRYNLVLLADRFKNQNDYLDLRYQLIHLKQDINAS